MATDGRKETGITMINDNQTKPLCGYCFDEITRGISYNDKVYCRAQCLNSDLDFEMDLIRAANDALEDSPMAR